MKITFPLSFVGAVAANDLVGKPMRSDGKELGEIVAAEVGTERVELTVRVAPGMEDEWKHLVDTVHDVHSVSSKPEVQPGMKPLIYVSDECPNCGGVTGVWRSDDPRSRCRCATKPLPEVKETATVSPLMQLLDVQGEIRIRLMKAGASEAKSLDLACELIDYLLRSPIVKETYRDIYESLQ